MSLSFELSIEVSEPYDFTKSSLDKIDQNIWVKNQWPLVYFIRNESKQIAYVGESTNAASRIRNHLDNTKKSQFTKISIIGSDKFNKSATLDIESKLIQYISAEQTYKLQNGNFGLVNHNYYQQDLYRNLFKEVWRKLRERKIVSKSIEEIENSELFKYSPYKSLNEDQYKSVLDILESLSQKTHSKIFVKGSAGTGKTILATYLIKLLTSDISDSNTNEYSEDELREINLIKAFRKNYPNTEVALVVAMSSLRKTLQNVFSKIPGLKPSMIISPSDTFKKKYDLLIVDEAHRLRQYKNIGWRGVFLQNNKKLGLNEEGNELNWILANSKNQIFFYDPAQSVKPSDINAIHFSRLLSDKKTVVHELKSQMRVQGGINYISFIDDLLNVKQDKSEIFHHNKYEILVFDSLKDLYKELSKKEVSYGLCRLIAGYSWPWKSQKNKKAIDIVIDGESFRWNTTDKGWINSPNAFKEVGCIHTTQGYDLNYVGVIFGKEIKFNPLTKEMEIDSSQYFDKNGKIGIKDPKELKAYIINIYKTIMYRGIKGTFIYACDKNLRDYFKSNIETFKGQSSLRVLKLPDVIPYVNSVPFFDISIAAGSFGEQQISSHIEWIELPFNVVAKKDYFVCKIKGESMNKEIPNGSLCLFKKDPGGSREGKIVLVQHNSIQESDFGAGYTIKEYHSIKEISPENWTHKSIELRPLSTDKSHASIFLKEDEVNEFKIIGIFDRVLNER